MTENHNVNTSAEPEADLALSGPHLLALRPHMSALRSLHRDALAQVAEDAAEPLERRHGAGLLLGLVGDPRIVPDDPSMIDLPAADVLMGLPLDQLDAVTDVWAPFGVQRDWIAKETPRHTVRVHAFRIGRYPVTNGEFLRFVIDQPTAERPTVWAHGVYPIGADNQPVYSVSPSGADAYAAWLAERTGRSFRLPTEAEWEYAASNGDGRQFPWGDDWDATRVNSAEAGPLTSTPVGIYVHGNAICGAADMAGNVEEYVSDNYRPYPGAAVVHDDLIDTHGHEYRVARGGSYARHGDLVRCARRHGWYPSDHFAMGFRLAETP